MRHVHELTEKQIQWAEDIQTIMGKYCGCAVRWGRIKKAPDIQLIGQLVRVTHEKIFRRGGGFIFHIDYKGKVLPHRQTLQCMFNDFKAQSKRNIKAVHTNVSVDLEFLVGLNGKPPKWTLFGDILPNRARMLEHKIPAKGKDKISSPMWITQHVNDVVVFPSTISDPKEFNQSKKRKKTRNATQPKKKRAKKTSSTLTFPSSQIDVLGKLILGDSYMDWCPKIELSPTPKFVFIHDY